jgi:hypothetical protein
VIYQALPELLDNGVITAGVASESAASLGLKPWRESADSGLMIRTENRRSDGRLLASFECLCATTRRKAEGVLKDISYSGALVECTGFVPSRGELVGLTFDEPVGGVLLTGWVVRHESNGFALEFEHLDEKARRLVDDLASIVAANRRHARRGSG